MTNHANTEQPDPDLPSRTVVYAMVGSVNLEMDLWMPSATGGPRPCVLCIHGGGWANGRRQQFAWHAGQLARRGYVAATISYRLSGVATYPAALDDCQRAVRWIRRHADELRVDPHRIGALGSSSGGHLAAMLGVRETRDDGDAALAGLSSRVQCVVDVHGIHDMSAGAGPVSQAFRAAFLGGPPEARPELWDDASPIRFVDSSSAPTLLTHDPGDTTVAFDQSARFAASLIAAGRSVEFLPTPGSGHGFVYNLDHPWTQRVWPVALAWFDRHLRPE